VVGECPERALKGAPSDQRSRIVWSTEVLRNSSLTTVRSGIHGEIAIAGIRTPERSNAKSICPRGAPGSGGGAAGGGTWSYVPPCLSKFTISTVL